MEWAIWWKALICSEPVSLPVSETARILAGQGLSSQSWFPCEGLTSWQHLARLCAEISCSFNLSFDHLTLFLQMVFSNKFLLEQCIPSVEILVMQKNMQKKSICPSSCHSKIIILEIFFLVFLCCMYHKMNFSVLKFFSFFYFCLYFTIYSSYLLEHSLKHSRRLH